MQSAYFCIVLPLIKIITGKIQESRPCLLESIRMTQIIIFYTLGSPCEASMVLRRSNGYDPTVAAHPANAPLA